MHTIAEELRADVLTAALPLLYLVRHWAWAPSATRAHTRLRQEWFAAIAQH